MEFTAENVETAITEFYRHQGKVNRDCHEWLKNCQSSREAWQVVWPLLTPQKSLQIQFVAANILHYKVSRCLHEVPPSDCPALKDNLIATVARYISGPALVLTRLELTLGAFITNTIGPIWANPLEEIGTVFQPSNFPGVSEHHVLRLLVQIFSFIPEQAQSQWQHSSRKNQAYRELQNKGETVFAWLFNVVQKQPTFDILMEGLKAMNSWMKLFCVCEWSGVNELIDVLVTLCGNSVAQEQDLVCELGLEILSGLIADPTTHSHPKLILSILDKILTLQGSLEIILQRQDMELAGSFYGIYVALADCHSKLVIDVCDEESVYNQENLKNRTNALILVDILLRCTSTPGSYPVDEIVSSLTISVWYSFVEEIQSMQTEGMKYARLMQVFEWVYKSLAETLIRKAQYPVMDSGWNSEDQEQFRIYRQDVCDCLTYCFELRGWTMLNELVEVADAQMQLMESNPDQVLRHWVELESLLMGTRAVTENISDERDPLVIGPMTKVFGIIYRILKLNQERRIPKVFQTAVECISTCSGMLSSFEAVVQSIIGFILDGLFQADTVSSAALALKALSRDCTRPLADFAPQILSTCKRAFDTGVLSHNDCTRLVYCTGKFLPYLPSEQIIVAVNEIFSPSLQHLHAIAGENPKPELKSQLVNILSIMSTLCSSLDQTGRQDDDDSSEDDSIMENNNNASQDLGLAVGVQDQSREPLIPVIEQILPVLVPVAEKWAKDEDVMDTLFSILKYTIATIHTASPIVIEYAIQLVLISYRVWPHMSATALAKQVILMLGQDSLPMQCQFLQSMHSLCAEPLKNCRDYLGFAESYFVFMAHLIKTNVALVNATGIDLKVMLIIAIEALGYTEAQLLKSSIYFIQMTLERVLVVDPPLVEFYQTQGLYLIRTVLVSIGYTVPRSLVHNFADIFLGLNRAFTAEWRRWLQEALAPEGFPSPHCTADAKNIFFLKATKERVNKRSIQDTIGEFAVACRNLSGSDYGAMTSKRN